MRRTLTTLLTASLCVLPLATGGCREEGPAERAGKAVDEAVDDLTGRDDLGDRTEDALEDARDAAEDAYEDAKDAVDDVVDEAEERFDEATGD